MGGVLQDAVNLMFIWLVIAAVGLLGYTGILFRQGVRWPVLLWPVACLLLFFVLSSKLFLATLAVSVFGFTCGFLQPDAD